MSQRDVLAELRTAHVEAPSPLRARVRLIAAQAPTPRRTRRRFALVLIPVVAAAVAAGVYFSTRPAQQPTVERGLAFQTRSSGSGAATAQPAPAPSAKRLQRYGASLDLQVKNVADVVARAQRIAASLGGFTSSVHLSTQKTQGHADLVLRVPRTHVQAAIARLRRLGAVLGEEVDIQDLQAGINTTDRTIARLEHELKTASKDRAAALTAQIRALQRQRAVTVRTAHFATVRLSLSTPPVKAKKHHHYLHDALPWLGGAGALLVLLLALRGLAQLREARLLSRS